MKKPIIFIVDDDAQVLKAISRDIKKQYRKAYRIVETTSANEALASLTEFKKRGEVVAMFLSDQRMDEMLGVDFLEQAMPHFPTAKRVLLTAYSDTDAAIKAINEVNLDYYLMKPWDPPEERMYPVVDELLDDWGSTNQPEFQGIRIVGYQWSPRSHKIKDYLGGNLIPYRWLDLETSVEARELLDLHQIDEKSLPALFFEDGSFLTDPRLPELGEKLGKKSHAIESMYDVVIIGAGPAGLAAAVYGGSEGLKTLLIEKRAPGGQAGTSSRIENYLGFPSGLSGSDLARRAITQATRFGIEFLSPQEVLNIRLQDNYKILTLADQSEVSARSIVITTGVDYRRLPADNIDEFTGAGVYYGAATTEAGACKDQDVFVVGGGNSAGQGAMYLSKFAKNVFIVIRKPDLSASMSQYLIDQIAATANIEVLPFHQIVAVAGDSRLEKLTLKNIQSDELREAEAGALFVFIGARPFTEWIDPEILRDPRGFIKTGRDLAQEANFREVWKLERQPSMLETSSPGIFAAGDVRSGAMNRVASAVGEGAMAIKFGSRIFGDDVAMPTNAEAILVVSVVILAVTYIVADYQRLQGWIYILKPLTMLMIIAVALTGNPVDGHYRILIAAGLLVSLGGDCFLMLPSDRFLHGLIAFFLAHLLYIAAFAGISDGTGGWWIAAALGLMAVVVYRQLRSGLGALKPAVAIYMMIIVIMGWRAWEVWLATGQTPGLLAAVGATLFIISDTALASERFGKPYLAARGLIMSTYFGGQLLIALSV